MDRLTVLDVSVTGTSPGRFDPDGYELSGLLRGLRRQRQDFLKGYAVRNDMIGWKDKLVRIRIRSGGTKPSSRETVSSRRVLLETR